MFGGVRELYSFKIYLFKFQVIQVFRITPYRENVHLQLNDVLVTPFVLAATTVECSDEIVVLGVEISVDESA